jgi:short-subunit dehydrogenase
VTDHWLVLGASSAIARAFVREVAVQGVALSVAGRDRDDLLAIAADARLRGAADTRVLACDAADPGSIAALIDSATLDRTRLNVFLAIGDMPDQPAMDRDPALLARMLTVNFNGAVALLQGLAPLLEHEGSGRLVVLGSVAGDRGRRKNYLYGASKAALATYVEGLRARLYPAGVTVLLVKPGFVDTAMTWGLPGLFLVASPQQCAAAVLRAANRGKHEIYHPFFWRFIMFAIRHLPAAVMKRLNF